LFSLRTIKGSSGRLSACIILFGFHFFILKFPDYSIEVVAAKVDEHLDMLTDITSLLVDIEVQYFYFEE